MLRKTLNEEVLTLNVTYNRQNKATATREAQSIHRKD